MNIPIITLLMACIVFPTLSLAADKKVPTAAITERAALLQTLARGSNISSNNQQYEMLLGVRAAEISPNELPQQAITRMGGGQLVESKGSFVLFTSTQQSAASLKSANGTSYPTAINSRTGGIGIVPGTLNVKLKNINNANIIATAYGLDVVRVFEHLKTAFYRVKSGQDVVTVAASLASDARVENAEMEVIEHISVPY